ncbi:unnamed protein product [Camellia sinensis]
MLLHCQTQKISCCNGFNKSRGHSRVPYLSGIQRRDCRKILVAAGENSAFRRSHHRRSIQRRHHIHSTRCISSCLPAPNTRPENQTSGSFLRPRRRVLLRVTTVGPHGYGHGPEPWLNHHADFQRLFLAGDSAGGNICHTLAVRVGTAGLDNLKVVGAVMGHPYFGGNEDDEMWLYMCPTNEGLEDRTLKPAAEDLARIGCERVLVLVAEKDHLMGVGRAYHEELKESGWKGTVEIVESEGEDHCFHVDNPTCESSVDLIKKIVSFIIEQ